MVYWLALCVLAHYAPLGEVPIIIREWLPNMVKLSGVLDSVHSREDTNILVAQIILRSDYSGSVKELW